MAIRLDKVVAPIVTTEDKGIESLVRHITLDGKRRIGILSMGATGDFHRVSNDIRLDYNAKVSEVISSLNQSEYPEVSFFMGINGDIPEETIKNARDLRVLNPTAMVVAPKYHLNYNSMSTYLNNLVKTAEGVPILLYNNPEITGGKNITLIELIDLEYKGLIKPPGIIGIKDSSGKEDLFMNYIQIFDGENFVVYQGNERLWFNPKYRSHGVVAGMANVFPELWYDSYLAAKNKDGWRLGINFGMVNAVQQLYDGDAVSALKYMLKKLGVVETFVIEENLNTSQKRKIDDFLKSKGYI